MLQMQLLGTAGGYADQALKTARRLWRLGGGVADFRVGVGAHHTGDEPM